MQKVTGPIPSKDIEQMFDTTFCPLSFWGEWGGRVKCVSDCLTLSQHTGELDRNARNGQKNANNLNAPPLADLCVFVSIKCWNDMSWELWWLDIGNE